MYALIRDILFKFDPEYAHTLSEIFLRHIANKPLIQDFILKLFFYQNPILKNEVCGISFSNPIGMAAGFDKNATMIEGLATLGFGYLELGTITKYPQAGNDKPRLWRHIAESSIQNAMGFNNDGSANISQRLSKIYPFKIPLGINLGKNKDVPIQNALRSYEEVFLDFKHLGDYYVFNLSSPNTPNLRDLQNISFVDELFSMAREYTQKPIFLKISPDMQIEDMLKVCEKAIQKKASGIIATNTSIDYSLVPFPKDKGGISGLAIKEKSYQVFKILAQNFFSQTTLISAGGIDNANEAYKRIRMGASLLQIFTSFIYKGPSLCKNINQDLAILLKQDGFENISQAIGVDL